MPENEKSTPRPIRKNLFDYLSHLDKDKDFPAIKKYLQSPFFGVDSSEKVIELFELLMPHHPDYKGNPELSIGSLNKKMGITFVQNLKSTLVKCIENYLKIKRVEENEQWSVLLLAESLDKMNMHKELIRYINNNLEIIEKIKAYTEDEYYLKYKLLLKKHQKLPDNKNTINDTSLEEAILSLSHYYLYSNLINLIGNKMESIIFKRETNVSLTENMVNSVLHFKNILDPNITINYYIFKFYDLNEIEEKKETYFIIKKIVTDQWERVNSFNRHEIYLNIISIIQHIISDGTDFEKEQFETHKFWIEKNVHKYYKNIKTALFMSIIVSASTVNEFKWCKNFILENKDMLVESEKDETIIYCKAYMLFKQKKYYDSLKLLNTIRFSNPLFELNLKMVEIKCLFEKSDNNRFNVCIKNIKNFIGRHKKLSDRIKIMHLNAVKYIEKVAKARSTNNIGKLTLLKQKINEEVNLTSKVWLIKKIEEII